MGLQLILTFKYLSTHHVETNTSSNNDRSMLPILFILFLILRCACIASSASTSLSLFLSLSPVSLDFPTLTSPIFKLRCLQQGCGRQKGGFKLSIHLPYRVAGFHPSTHSAHSHLGNSTHIPIHAHKFTIFRYEHL